MALTAYQLQLRDLLNDPNKYFFSDTQLTGYINRARQIIARETYCVRAMPSPTASVASYTVTAGGSYATAPTVSVTAPDGMGIGFVNATATATLTGAAVTAVNVVLGGTGYLTPPRVSFSGGGGGGATATAVLTSFWHTNANQEVYNFTDANTILTAQYPGIQSIIGVQTVAVSWGSWKPVLNYIPWSANQAYFRSQNVMVQNYPEYWSQYAQGEAGSIYLYSIPAQLSQMEWDCYCVPINLADDTTAEAIPGPWVDAICFLSAYYAYLNAQRQDAAALMTSEYKRYLREGRAAAQPAMVPTFYESGY